MGLLVAGAVSKEYRAGERIKRGPSLVGRKSSEGKRIKKRGV